MKYIFRLIQNQMNHALERNKSVLLLGPRQTGKTTLLNQWKSDLFVSFAQVDVRLRYEKNPSILAGEVEALASKKEKKRPLVFLDEVQKVPLIFDVVQDLIDRRAANFVLSGSSARKLRRGSHVNLLPGRVVSLRLDPFTLQEMPATLLNHLILYGSLPGITQAQSLQDKEADLESYATTYLEEEVRAEAIVRNLGHFARFLELAASESGFIVNFKKLSQEIGVADTTITSYYQILEDCLIVERIDPLTKSKIRKKLTKSPRYLFFDLGVRRKAAQEGAQLPRETLGNLFEQWVGLELIRNARLSGKSIKILFWRDPNGPEVDWVVRCENTFIPVEVKWTDVPRARDVKHLKIFLDEHPNASEGYLVCQIPRPMRLEKGITAIPWQEVDKIINSK